MCTAAIYKTKDFYMGRTLDYECSYGEEVTITPLWLYIYDAPRKAISDKVRIDRYGTCGRRVSTVL